MDPSFNQNGPQFSWPQTTEQNQDEAQTNQILTSIKNVVTEFMKNQTKIPETTTSGDFQSTSGRLFTNQPGGIKEVFSMDPVESSNSTTISEMVQDSVTIIADAITTQLPETTINPIHNIGNDILKNSTNVDLAVDPLISEVVERTSTTVTELLTSHTITTELPTTIKPDDVLTEMFNSNTTVDQVITGMVENNSTILTEMVESNSTTLTEMVGSNSTTLTEMIGSNSTILTEMTQSNNSMESAGGSILTQMGQDGGGSVAITENASTSSVSEMVTEAVSNATEAVTEIFDHSSETSEKDVSMIEDKTLYIVVGTILVFLIILLVVLLVIYKRYKANGWARSRSYHVANFSGVSVDSQKVCN